MKDKLVASLIAILMMFTLISIPKITKAVGDPTLTIEVPNSTYEIGDIFIAQVKVSDVTFTTSQISVYFNPSVLQIVDNTGVVTSQHKGLIANDTNMGAFGDWTLSQFAIYNEKGLVEVAIHSMTPYAVTAVDDYIGIRFKAIGNGNPNIHFATSASPEYTPANSNGYIFTSGTEVTMNLIEPTVTVGSPLATHTVTFKDHDGTVLDTQTVNSGEDATAPADPTRIGYTFDGWNVTFTNITADLTVNATYTIKTYTVRFEDYDGVVLKTETVNYGATATAPTNPTRTGYTFANWDVAFTNITADITVTATYTIKTYTVRFEDYNGSVLKTETVNYGASATAPSAPTRVGYTFAGWDVVFTNITADITVTAKWTKDSTSDSYTVTFEDYNGTVIDTQTVESGENATAPGNPTRTGYTFSGWDVSFTNITEDLTVTATYAINTYTVKFEDHDGTLIDTQTVNHGASATAPVNPTRTGYTFDRWDVALTNITENTTVKALYRINSYTVKFEDHDGTLIDTQTVNHGASATAPAEPTRTGYIFANWSVGFTNITADLTVTARYTINAYTVTFKNYDGSVLKTETVDYGADATAPANPTRTGYNFVGWDVGFTNITENTTVNPQYRINTYTVTFKDHDGTILKTETVDYGTGATAPANPARTGYNFLRWDVAFTNITIDTTVTATYGVNTYSVTFKDHDGTILKTETVDYGADATAPAEPTRTGHTFVGWDAGFTNITENTTVNAKYRINTYTVTFKDHDGTELKTETVDYGAGATAPANPERTGYIFAGWDVAFTNITADTIVTATYTSNTFTVTFKDHDGTELKKQEVNYGEDATSPENPTRTGYDFDGWDVAFTNITADITVTAKYVKKAYTVKFKDHDGTELKKEMLSHGEDATAPTEPTRKGYKFVGWDLAFTNITEDITVTAKWEKVIVDESPQTSDVYSIYFIMFAFIILSISILLIVRKREKIN